MFFFHLNSSHSTPNWDLTKKRFLLFLDSFSGIPNFVTKYCDRNLKGMVKAKKKSTWPKAQRNHHIFVDVWWSQTISFILYSMPAAGLTTSMHLNVPAVPWSSQPKILGSWPLRSTFELPGDLASAILERISYVGVWLMVSPHLRQANWLIRFEKFGVRSRIFAYLPHPLFTASEQILPMRGKEITSTFRI